MSRGIALWLKRGPTRGAVRGGSLCQAPAVYTGPLVPSNSPSRVFETPSSRGPACNRARSLACKCASSRARASPGSESPGRRRARDEPASGPRPPRYEGAPLPLRGAKPARGAAECAFTSANAKTRKGLRGKERVEGTLGFVVELRRCTLKDALHPPDPALAARRLRRRARRHRGRRRRSVQRLQALAECEKHFS
jgi:hypothetical protein